MMRTTKQIRPECGLQGLIRPSIYNFRFNKSTLTQQCTIVGDSLKDLMNATKAPGRPDILPEWKHGCFDYHMQRIAAACATFLQFQHDGETMRQSRPMKRVRLRMIR
jgi:hypothetical protein